MKRISVLILALALAALLIPVRWVSLGAPNVTGSVFHMAAEPQQRQGAQSDWRRSISWIRCRWRMRAIRLWGVTRGVGGNSWPAKPISGFRKCFREWIWSSPGRPNGLKPF